MSVQSFRRVKIDINDKLFSEIIRGGAGRCRRCHFARPLQCAHIMGRGSYSTRFQLEPVPNAIPLCAECHDWFDSHKISAVMFDEKKRVFSAEEESYTFLVKNCSYTWEDLQKLYVTSKNTVRLHYRIWKDGMKQNLRKFLKEIETGVRDEFVWGVETRYKDGHVVKGMGGKLRT